MGCATSIPKTDDGVSKKKKKKRGTIGEVAVFVPEFQIPAPTNFARPLGGLVSRELIDRLSSLRNRIVSLAEGDVMHDVLGLEQALLDYLPVVLGLTRKENNLESLVEFKWRMLSEDGQETCLTSAWYEVLSVVHLMAMLALFQANLMLVPKESPDESEQHISDDSRTVVVELLLKASGCLDYCVRHIMVHLPLQIRKNLPDNLQEGMLEAMSVLALAQAIEMQLGLALESEKATLSVKRRLACEAVSYFTQAHYSLTGCNTSDGCGKKLLLFIQWKYLDAKAAAYYYHSIVLDKGNTPSDHIGAVYCLLAAEELLREGKKACLSFCLAAPVTRVPPIWGVMKPLNKKIPEMASKKAQMYGYLFEQDKVCQSLPDLPEFQLSLKPDDFDLPEIDTSWYNEKCEPQVQPLKEHLKDEEEDEVLG